MTGQNSFWFANPSTGFYNGVIDQSLRFEDGDSPYLDRTPSSETDRDKFTWSCWIKRGVLDQLVIIFQHGASNNNSTSLFIESDNTLTYQHADGGGATDKVQTNAVLRDTTNFYHIALAVDTTQSTDSNRVRLYINGVYQSSLATANYPTQNTDTDMNTTNKFRISGQTAGTQFPFDGYMAEVNFLDGIQVGDTQDSDGNYILDEFGKTKNGVWIPKAYSGSYGTNGFRLTFADSSSLGDDTSGNGNDFTSSGLASTDVVKDSPTNNFCTFNSLEVAHTNELTLSEGNLGGVPSATSAWNTRVGNFNFSSGKWYAEFSRVTDVTGAFFGVLQTGSTDGLYIGYGSQGYGYYIENGNVQTSAGYATNGTGLGTATKFDVIGVALNLDDNELRFYKNGSVLGSAAIPITDASYAFGASATQSGNLIIANFGQDSSFAGYITSGSDSAQDANGQGDFFDAPPTGFLAMCSANMPDTGFNADEDNQPTDFHNVVLYTGNGYPTSNSNTITGVGFQPDWVWIKDRDNSNINHSIYDSTRGVTKELSSNATTAEGTESTFLTAFNSDGFVLGAGNEVNTQNIKFVAWNWKINGGTTATDTTGSQDSIIQTNQTLGMTIGLSDATSGTYTFAHGLGATPEFLMYRNKDSTDNWQYWHTGMGAAGTSLMYLNNTGARSATGSAWLSTLSSTLIGITAGQATGTSGTHLFWAFRSIEGFSKFGNYEGNASTDGTYTYTGFRPSLIWLKNYDTGVTGHLIFDDVRHESSNAGNVRQKTLRTDSADAEDNSYKVDFLSNGFKIRTGDTNFINAGDTYIYWAWAHNPFKFSNAF